MTTSSRSPEDWNSAHVLEIKGDEIRPVVRACVAELLEQPLSAFALDPSLISLGADSILFVTLIFRLEREFNVAIDRRFAVPDDDYTVDSFVLAVAEALTKSSNAL